MSSKHTPGPWTAEKKHVMAGGIHGPRICTAYWCAGDAGYPPEHDQAAANARLLAAAPDLLAACEAARLQLEPLGHSHPPNSPIGRVLNQLDDAIGEARR